MYSRVVMCATNAMGWHLEVASMVGLCLSLYAVYVEHKNEEDPSYEAVCDVNERMSCSKVLMSEWGHIFSQLGVFPKGHPLDLANATYGVMFYSVVMFHRLLPLSSYRNKAKVVFALTVPVVVRKKNFICGRLAWCKAATPREGLSLYLAYILFFVLGDICLVCLSVYAVNGSLLSFSYKALDSGTAVTRASGGVSKARIS